MRSKTMNTPLITSRRVVNASLHIVNKALASMVGTALHNKVNAYWFNGYINFGDLITPLLLKAYGFTPVHSSPGRSEIVCAGSILDQIPTNYPGYILGSGLLHDRILHLPNATILAVRGELTRERIGAPRNVVLGDPGMLAHKLIKRRQDKCYILGLVPHMVDEYDPRVRSILRRYRSEVLIINVRRRPSVVYEDIDKCEFVLSSSLHGIIAADSLGIPNSWMLLSDKVHGKGFKFADYNSALGTKRAPMVVSGNESLTHLIRSTRRPPESVASVRDRLDGMFRFFAENFRSS